jgi:hypothetical protein
VLGDIFLEVQIIYQMHCPVGMEITDCSIEDVENKFFNQGMKDARKRVLEVKFENGFNQIVSLDLVPELQIANSDQVVDDLFKSPILTLINLLRLILISEPPNSCEDVSQEINSSTEPPFSREKLS